MTPEEIYKSLGGKIKNAEMSQMFGKPCLKMNGKAFASLFNNEMVFKLNGDMHKEALSLDGSSAFDPSGKGRPMREWVQVSAHYSDQWLKFAKSAAKYVSGL